jgi:hypothetical protein
MGWPIKRFIAMPGSACSTWSVERLLPRPALLRDGFQGLQNQIHNQTGLTIPVWRTSFGIAPCGVRAAVLEISTIGEMKRTRPALVGRNLLLGSGTRSSIRSCPGRLHGTHFHCGRSYNAGRKVMQSFYHHSLRVIAAIRHSQKLLAVVPCTFLASRSILPIVLYI